MNTNTASVEELDSAKQLVEVAHAAYSAAFHRREDGEKHLAACAVRRAALVRELKRTQRLLDDQTQAVIQHAIDEPAKADASKVLAARAKVDLLKKALQQYSTFGYSDAERALLIARIDELTEQMRFERLRCDVQRQNVLLSLASTMDIAGDLEVNSLGSVTSSMERIVHEIGERLANARAELREHERVATEAQTTYERTTANV
jgi:hypothetical protein